MTDSKINSAINAMMRADKLHRHLIDLAVAKIGLHRTHHMVLMHIAKCGKINSQKALADHIGITPAAITGVIKRLEKDGYIRRTQAIDSRYNEVEITADGRTIVEDTRVLFSAVDASLFAGFTDEELDGYIAYLEKITANIEKQISSV